MNKENLHKLINECIKERQFKNEIKQLISESIKEIKAEEKQTCQKMIEEIESDVKKEIKEISVCQDDAGFYNVCGCPPHHVKLKHLYEDMFNMTYMKDGTDRTRKVYCKFEDVKKFLKEVLGKKTVNYKESAYNKAAENSKDKESKTDGDVKRIGEKAKDVVENKDDLPDQPFKEVKSVKKQTDHSVKGTKPDYKYPKQTNNKLVVKLKKTKKKSTKKS